MRRKPGTLVPLEVEILHLAVSRAASNRPEFHGFELAKLIAGHERSGTLLSHGTLYKALNRLADSGMLTSDWEDAATALNDGRPRRRLYRLTVRGEQAAAAAATSDAPKRASVGRLGLEPT
jgi:PadR family transcriptional regulator, regulatory protein PadR